MGSVALTLRFMVELSALAALGYWGYQTGGGSLGKLILGAGAPLVAAIVWGACISPKAPMALSAPARLALELLLLGSAVVALYATGRTGLAWTLGVAVVVQRVLVWALGV